MESQIIKRAQQIMNGNEFKPCSCGLDCHDPNCDYEMDVDIKWTEALDQAAGEDLFQPEPHIDHVMTTWGKLK